MNIGNLPLKKEMPQNLQCFVKMLRLIPEIKAPNANPEPYHFFFYQPLLFEFFNESIQRGAPI